MAPPLLECVPNLSEGRRLEVVGDLVAAATAAGGARLLDASSDPDHNRSVLTLAGSAPGLHEALGKLFRRALGVIDLRRHEGAHPRVGAVDVVPFVPLGGARMADAVAAAEALAAAVAAEHGLPVFLYGAAARRPERRELPDVRRGGFEGLAERLADPEWRPDFGPRRPHPSAGAAVIGARRILVAFNAELDTGDVRVARRVARRVRESSGGLPAVRAIGVWLAARGRAQVSMNLTDYRRTGMATALAAVEREAAREGASVAATEVVGLAPRAALEGASPEALRLRGFDDSRVLESRLERLGWDSRLPAAD